MRTNLRMMAIAALVAAGGAACSGSTTPDTTEPATSPTPAPTIGSDASPTVAPSTRPPATEQEIAIATEFLRARTARDVDAARAYLDPEVRLDWGPGQTYGTLDAGMAWEDAFGIVTTLQGCHGIEAPGSADVQCQVMVQTAVAEALGRAPGIDCVDITIGDRSITLVELGAQGPDCDYDYWTSTFVPFYDWMRTAHPESDPDAMYADRISPEGLARWAQYTEEFLADRAS